MKKRSEVDVKGFALMELLIALALFAAISGVLMSSFFQFQYQSNRMEKALKLRQEIRILEQIIRNDIQSVIYLNEFMQGQKDEMADRRSGIYGLSEFSGEKSRDTIHLHINKAARFFRSQLPANDPMIHEVSYFMEPSDSNGYAFKRREEYYIDDDITSGERSITHTLSSRVVSFDVQYYKEGQTEPVEEWDSVNQPNPIPDGVIVSLELSEEEGVSEFSEIQINLRPYMGQFVKWRI